MSSTDQRSLNFNRKVMDVPKAIAATDRIVKETYDHSKEELKATLELALRYVAHSRLQFTADHVWAHLGEKLDASLSAAQKSVVGQIFRNLSKQGIISQTGNFIRSERPSTHRRILPVWESHVYEINRQPVTSDTHRQ